MNANFLATFCVLLMVNVSERVNSISFDAYKKLCNYKHNAMVHVRVPQTADLSCTCPACNQYLLIMVIGLSGVQFGL